MEVSAKLRGARISAQKARLVADQVRGKPVGEALNLLEFSTKKAAHLVRKVLNSAIANAENNHELSADELIVGEAVIGEGPTLKRFKPRARGSAGAIRKRTSHIFITLTDEFEAPEEKKRSGKAKKRDTAKPMFGQAKAAPAKEEPVAEEEVVEEEAAEEVEATEESTEPAAE